MYSQSVLQDVGDEPEVEIGAIDDDAEQTCDDDAEKDNAEFAEVEAVHFVIDDGEHFEEGVVDAVDETAVGVDEKNGGILDHDLERFDQRIGKNFRWL